MSIKETNISEEYSEGSLQPVPVLLMLKLHTKTTVKKKKLKRMLDKIGGTSKWMREARANGWKRRKSKQTLHVNYATTKGLYGFESVTLIDMKKVNKKLDKILRSRLRKKAKKLALVKAKKLALVKAPDEGDSHDYRRKIQYGLSLITTRPNGTRTTLL
jgi:hypothetical protein